MASSPSKPHHQGASVRLSVSVASLSLHAVLVLVVLVFVLSLIDGIGITVDAYKFVTKPTNCIIPDTGLPSQCPSGRCLFEHCDSYVVGGGGDGDQAKSKSVGCDGGGCVFRQCVSPHCKGGLCEFVECDRPTCKGGACKFTNTKNTLKHGYCKGGSCTIDGLEVRNDMGDHLSF